MSVAPGKTAANSLTKICLRTISLHTFANGAIEVPLPVLGRPREELFVCVPHPNASPVIAAAGGHFSVPERRRGVREMPRYFFHVKRGQMTVLDQDGIELADTVEAEIEAARRAQQIVGEEVSKGVPSSTGRMIIVADENWQRLFELSF